MSTKRLLAALLVLLMLFALLPASALAEEPEAKEETQAQIPAEEAASDEPESVSPVNPPVGLNYGYYLIGRYGWTINDLEESRDKFTQSSYSPEEYKLITTLEEGQQIKVVLVSNGTQLGPYYPDPGDNYVVDAAHAGTKIIYFRPNYNSDWAQFGGYIWIDDVPIYHVYFNQPEHGTLTAEPTDPHEGDTVTITAVPDPGYFPSGAIKSNDWPPNFSNYDPYHASFTMPGNDVTVFMQGNSMSVDAGYYCGVDKGVSSLTPDDKFRNESSEWGEYSFETVVEEGQSLSVMCITTNGSWSWYSPLVNYTISAEQAGPIKVFLTETDPGEGYTKVIEVSHWAGSGPVIDKEAWMIVKSALPITVDPNIVNGTVTAPARAFEGETVSLTVTPNTGYELDTLTVADANGSPIQVDGNSFVMPDAPVTVTATFKQAVMYSVTVVGSAEGCTVVADKQTAQAGETVTITVTNDNDHRLHSIDAVDADGNPVTLTKIQYSNTKYTFEMPAADVTVTAVTKQIFDLRVGATQVDSLNMDDVLGDGTVSYDPVSHTLTMTSPTPAYIQQYSSGWVSSGMPELIINAPNGLQFSDPEGSVSYAVSTYNNGDLIINGDVELDMPYSNGIYSLGALTVTGNVTGSVNAFILFGNTSVTVNGNVNATNNDYIRAIYCAVGDIEINGDFSGKGYGIDANAGSIAVTGSVSISASTNANNYGLKAAGSISVGGDFSFTGKAAYAAYAGQDFSCGGSVTVVNTQAQGICAYAGTITVVGGTWDVLAASNPLKALNGIAIPESHAITEPAGGQIAQLSGFYVVTEADGETLTTHVIIEEAAAAVTLSLDANGGTVEPASVQIAPGAAIGELPVPEREGWVFLGWFTAAPESLLVAGQGTAVTAESVFSEDTTVYAHWRLPGDINGDGEVNNKDLTRLQRYIKYQDVDVVELNLDVNGDGSLGNKDLTRLQRYVKYHDVEIH